MTQTITVRRWESTTDEALTEAAVRARYPSEKYRVSVYRYPSHASFSGATRRATCYVVSGVGRYVFESEATVRGGDVVDLPEGSYSLEVIGDDELVLIYCWELPFEFNRLQ